jgi:hypothetical protein
MDEFDLLNGRQGLILATPSTERRSGMGSVHRCAYIPYPGLQWRLISPFSIHWKPRVAQEGNHEKVSRYPAGEGVKSALVEARRQKSQSSEFGFILCGVVRTSRMNSNWRQDSILVQYSRQLPPKDNREVVVAQQRFRQSRGMVDFPSPFSTADGSSHLQ